MRLFEQFSNTLGHRRHVRGAPNSGASAHIAAGRSRAITGRRRADADFLSGHRQSGCHFVGKAKREKDSCHKKTDDGQ
jgi:hypothetical protein